MNQENGESRFRNYVWGVMILVIGALTIFGYWFLLAG